MCGFFYGTRKIQMGIRADKPIISHKGNTEITWCQTLWSGNIICCKLFDIPFYNFVIMHKIQNHVGIEGIQVTES